jgi:nucleotide-binding universal stress UspA family protein
MNGPIRHRRVVAGVHASANSMAALRRSMREATARHAQLDVVHVIPEGSATEATARREVAALLSEIMPSASYVQPRIRIERGDPGEVLVRLSADAELLVIGACAHSERRGIYGGQVVPFCLARAACPVAVCADHGASRSAEATGPPVLALVP